MHDELPPIPTDNPERGNLSSIEAGTRFTRMMENAKKAADDLLETDPELHAKLVGKDLLPLLNRHLGAAFAHLEVREQDEILELLEAIRWTARQPKG